MEGRFAIKLARLRAADLSAEGGRGGAAVGGPREGMGGKGEDVLDVGEERAEAQGVGAALGWALGEGRDARGVRAGMRGMETSSGECEALGGGPGMRLGVGLAKV